MGEAGAVALAAALAENVVLTQLSLGTPFAGPLTVEKGEDFPPLATLEEEVIDNVYRPCLFPATVVFARVAYMCVCCWHVMLTQHRGVRTPSPGPGGGGGSGCGGGGAPLGRPSSLPAAADAAG